MGTVLGGLRHLRDPLVLLFVVLTLGGIGATGWAFYGRTKPTPDARTQKAVLFTRVVCPACEWERPYDSALEGQICPNCNAGASLVGAQNPNSGDANTGRGLACGLVMLTVLSAGTLFVRRRVRTLEGAATDEINRPTTTQCPFCGRRVRYPAARAGEVFNCSRCKTTFLLPPPT